MNMTTVDPADFAVFCVDGKPFDVRRRIFEVEDPALLRDALDLIERQDGDERLLDWLRLRLRVLEMLAYAARVEAGQAEPVTRKGSKKRPPPPVQVSLLAPVAAPVPPPVEPKPVLEPAPVVEFQEQPVEILAPTVEPVQDVRPVSDPVVQAPLATPAPFMPLVDPRPAVLLPIRPRRLSTFEREAPLGLAWVLWFTQRFWDRERGEARLHRRDLSALARGTRSESFERWGLDRWCARAWERGGAMETMAAACGLVATYDRHVLTLKLAGPSTGESG